MSEEDFFERIRNTDYSSGIEIESARKEFPLDMWVYINETKQVGQVGEIKGSPDGVLVRVRNIGLVPIGELRRATAEEIESFLNR